MMKKATLISLGVLLLSLFFFSCGKKAPKEVDPSFQKYVGGFTSGRISKNATIQVELTQDVDSTSFDQKKSKSLFQFSPSVKGKVYWKSPRLVEFVPDEPLKEGRTYDVRFSLGKLYQGVPKKNQTLEFQVFTTESDYSVYYQSYQPYTASSNRWNYLMVEVNTSDQVKEDQVKKAIQASFLGKALSVTLVSSSDKTRFQFKIDSIERQAKNTNLELSFHGKSIGVSKSIKQSVPIDAISTFRAIKAEVSTQPEKCIRVYFTDPLSNQDLSGLVNLSDDQEGTFRIDKNVLIIYPIESSNSEITIALDEELKNFEGRALGRPFSFTVSMQADFPQVRLLKSGTILPDAKKLYLAFEAINVKAVEMRVIKIYEHNVLSFLQVNSLSGVEEITRSGKMIAKKVLNLSSKGKNLSQWNTYAVDLSRLMAKEPGALYRFELIVRKEFSIYPCGEESVSQEGKPTTSDPDKAFELEAADLESWDGPYYYYSPINYDWSDYRWEERSDPCKPTYYMEAYSKVYTYCNLLASNIGVIAKRSETNEVGIHVQDICTTEPISSAKVRVLNFQLAQLAQGETDKEGFCSLKISGEPYFVEVTKGDQKAYLKMNRGAELSLSRFDVSGKTLSKGLKGYIFGERGVWRPGDELFLSFILEDKAKTLPKGHPIVMEVYTPMGQLYKRMTQSEATGNLFCFSFKTEEQSPTGLWYVVVNVGGVRFEKNVRIETIKPNRLKLNFDIGEDLIKSQEVTAKIEAKWLHGAIARNLNAKVIMKIKPMPTTFKSYERFVFSNPMKEYYESEDMVLSGTLDENGMLSAKINMPEASSAAGMLSATFMLGVEESGGGESILYKTCSYAPYPAFVGLDTRQSEEMYSLSNAKEHVFDVAFVDPNGKAIKSAELEYRLYKLDWSWWWDDYSRSGLSSVVDGNQKNLIQEKRIKIVDGKGTVSFKLTKKDWGNYFIYIADPNGGHATGKVFYVDTPYEREEGMQGDAKGLSMLKFTTDKKTYKAGEKVKITLPKGGEGRALVSLESGLKVKKQFWVKTKQGKETDISFEATADMAPNFYVYITWLQMHSQTLNDLPLRMYGVATVLVENAGARLKPILKMPDVLRAEREFTIEVSEANKREMSYTLAIVDEGLLDITSFKTPDPYNTFYAREALGVRTYDLYDEVVGAFSGELRPLYSIGGSDEVALTKKPDNTQRFKPVVKFLGPLHLEKGKTAKHKIKLPPYVGSVRVMLIASNEEASYGKAEKTVAVQNPLMILSTLPRVLGPNEEFVLPVNVFVMDKQLSQVKVEVQTSASLKPIGTNTKTVDFQGVGDKMVSFTYKVQNRVGKERVVIKATSGKETTSETIDIEIRNPNPPLLEYKYYLVEPGKEIEVPYQFEADMPDNKLFMEYARIPSVNLNAVLEYLIAYPHGCAEQTTSKVFAQLYLHEFVSLSSVQKERINVNIEEAIKKLYSLQTQEGGIAYWKGSSVSNEWVSSYVGHFVACAQEQGYRISPTFIRDLIKYLKDRSSSWQKGTYRDDLLQSYRLYSLAKLGSPDMPGMNKMRESTTVSFLAKWQLASTYILCGKKELAETMVNNIQNRIEPYSAFNETFGSSTRDEAIIMETYLLLGNYAAAMELAKRISIYLNANAYSTQTTAWSLLAMAEFANKSGKGDMNFSRAFKDKSIDVQVKEAVYREEFLRPPTSGTILVKNKGKANLYLGSLHFSIPIDDKSEPVNRNIGIAVSYEDFQGRAVDINEIKQGVDFFANIVVSNYSVSTRYTNLALTFAIPSGWEIRNDRLADDDPINVVSRDAGSALDIRDDRVLNYFWLNAKSSKVIRVPLHASYKGVFYMPAVFCEAMYDQTVFARTKATWLKVVE